jgi:transcriptional regulator GlxA family with amidase domain
MRNRTRPKDPRAGMSTKRVVILGLPPVDALDVIGPAEVFAFANKLQAGQPAPYDLQLVSAGADVFMDSESGIGLRGHRTLEQERRENKPIDTLMVATGFNPSSSYTPLP